MKPFLIFPAYITITNGQQVVESLAVLEEQLCQVRLEILRTQINNLVGSSNRLSLRTLFPPGTLTIARGSALYAITGIRTKVTLRNPGKGQCSHEIPVFSHESNTTSEKFCDAYTKLLSSQARNITCNNILPIRYSFYGTQICPTQDGLTECSDYLPPLPFEPQLRTWAVMDYIKGLSVSLIGAKDYTAHQFHILVERARSASLQDLIIASVENIRKFGLMNPLRGLDLQKIKDYIGREFVPMYQIFGPFVILGLCVCGTIGISVRILEAVCATVFIARTRGCGWRVLTGLFGKMALIPFIPLKYIIDNSSLKAEFLKAIAAPAPKSEAVSSAPHQGDPSVPKVVQTHPTYQRNPDLVNQGLEGPSDWPLALVPCCEKQAMDYTVEVATYNLAQTLPATVLRHGHAIDTCREAIGALQRDMRRSGVLPTEVDQDHDGYETPRLPPPLWRNQ